MRFKVQLVIESEDHRPIVTQLASLERAELDAGSLGLHLSEARSLLERCQTVMVTAQIERFVEQTGACPDCGRRLGHKGQHELVYRTVFGKLRLDSPRLYRCPKCVGGRKSFSPLAERLPERSSPELQYLQSKFASLMSYGLTVGVLGEVLPLDKTLSVSSVRRWGNRVSERIEHQAKDGHVSTKEVSASAPYVPQRSPVKAIGIDGGYIRRAGVKSRQEGWFEVMVGKSQREDAPGGCFAYVHRLEENPPVRMLNFLNHEGIQPDQPVTFLSDGGDTVRQAQFGYRMFGEWVLDWFHIAMRFQNLIQIAKGLNQREERPTRDDIIRDIERAKWHLWHGCAFRALRRLEWLTWDVGVLDPSEARDKLEAKLEENLNYFDKNQGFIVNYGDRYRHGDPISTGFVESAVNQVVSKRFVKKQQMAWSEANAHNLLQVRTATLNGELRDYFDGWYPSLAANDPCINQAA